MNPGTPIGKDYAGSQGNYLSLNVRLMSHPAFYPSYVTASLQPAFFKLTYIDASQNGEMPNYKDCSTFNCQ
ncbi:MAG: hypothetical protein LBU37_03575 [Tannerellaceae bacterium]|jgi:hypothetical protein|nr:hypothetical protein [Tannerellaceae bacterium]